MDFLRIEINNFLFYVRESFIINALHFKSAIEVIKLKNDIFLVTLLTVVNGNLTIFVFYHILLLDEERKMNNKIKLRIC